MIKMTEEFILILVKRDVAEQFGNLYIVKACELISPRLYHPCNASGTLPIKVLIHTLHSYMIHHIPSIS